MGGKDSCCDVKLFISLFGVCTHVNSMNKSIDMNFNYLAKSIYRTFKKM